MDPIAQFKENAKVVWSGFASMEALTASAVPSLVDVAGIKKGQEVLDVGCGSGVVALAAARLGARVTGLDLTPALIARAKENAALMQVEVQWHEGDAEALPFPDAKFDVVVSQFGHMFAPRPTVTVAEMLRVLKPGGTIAFSTWPPELFTGRLFAHIGKYAPPPPEGVSPPPQWGDPAIVRERLGAAVKDLMFFRDALRVPAISVQHTRSFFEQNLGPATKIVKTLEGSDPAKLAVFRQELDAVVTAYFKDNHLRQDFLMTRAIKA